MRTRVAAALAGAFLLLGQAAQAHGPTIEISAAGIAPAELTIARGETVHFHNGDARAHVVVGDNEAFRSPELAPGGGWHLRFPFPGRFSFALEERPTARGLIVVEDAER